MRANGADYVSWLMLCADTDSHCRRGRVILGIKTDIQRRYISLDREVYKYVETIALLSAKNENLQIVSTVSRKRQTATCRWHRKRSISGLCKTRWVPMGHRHSNRSQNVYTPTRCIRHRCGLLKTSSMFFYLENHAMKAKLKTRRYYAPC